MMVAKKRLVLGMAVQVTRLLVTSLFILFLVFAPSSSAAKAPIRARFIVHGKSMHPLIQDKEEIDVVHIPVEWRDRFCRFFQRGDIVLFQTAANKKAPVVKRVSGIPDDIIKVQDDGRVFVNDKFALAPSGKPYQALRRNMPMLKIYEGRIPKNKFLLLGNPGMLDSSRVGLIPCQKIIGKVIAPKR